MRITALQVIMEKKYSSTHCTVSPTSNAKYGILDRYCQYRLSNIPEYVLKKGAKNIHILKRLAN